MGRRAHVDVLLAESTWEAVSALVMLRPWSGRCERCGTRRPEHPHHRWLKSQGGLDVPSNIAALCSGCHRWVHEHPAEALWNPETGEGGWIVQRACGDPQIPWDFRGTPLRLADGLVVKLTDDYGYDVIEWAA